MIRPWSTTGPTMTTAPMRTRRRWLLAVTLLLIVGVTSCAGPRADPDTGASGTSVSPRDGTSKRYVALGSSYASGPGGTLTDRRCERSEDNYPSQTARALHMELVDASCAGATIADIVSRAQPHVADAPQIDAVTADTALVTLTVGGNNVGYMRRVMALSCIAVGPAEPSSTCNPTSPPPPTAADFEALTRSLTRLIADIAVRAPHAMIIVVDYPPLAVSGESGCAALPLTSGQIDQTSRVLDGVDGALAAATSATGTHLVRASLAGRAHGVCSAQPWLYGYGGPAPYHERPFGKTAISRLVAEMVTRHH